MKKPFGFYLFVILVLSFSLECQAITPGEVYENGRRAFLLGNWLEAREQFSRFNEAWPTHPLAPQSLYYRTMADVRYERAVNDLETRNKIGSLTAVMKALTDRLPEADVREIQVEIEYLQNRIPGIPTATPTTSLDMTPVQLSHALNRGWIPFPHQNPMATLDWLRTWMERHAKDVPPPLFGRLHLLRAKALWEIFLSPLPTSAFFSTLKSKGEWPIKSALERSLKLAFENGDPEIKREVALLGVSSEILKSKLESNYELQLNQLPNRSKWLKYLLERGVNFSEAWSPR